MSSSSNSQVYRGAGSRHYLLDGMRGLAAIIVCVYHYLMWSETIVVESAGLFAVAVFFILSALSMVMVYRSRFASGLNELNVREFFQNRVARLLPLLALVASMRLGYALVFEDSKINEVFRFFLTGSGLMSLQMPGYLASFVGSWSLGVEILFYLLFPSLFLLSKSISVRGMLMSVALLFAGQQMFIVLLVSERHEQLGDIEYWFSFVGLLIYAPFFAMGMLIEKTRFTPRRVHSFVGFAIFCMVMSFSSLVTERIITNHLLFLCLSIASGIAVFLVFHGSWSQRWVPIFRFAGNISYALYLIHWVVWFGVTAAEPVLSLPLLVKIPLAIVTSVVCAVALHRFFEMPLKKLLGARQK